MTRPDPKQVKVMTDVAGVPQDPEVSARIANSIGPAFDGFAPVAGTLPMDLEPASYMAIPGSGHSRAPASRGANAA